MYQECLFQRWQMMAWAKFVPQMFWDRTPFACMLFRKVSVYLKEVLINCQYLKTDSEFVFSENPKSCRSSTHSVEREQCLQPRSSSSLWKCVILQFAIVPTIPFCLPRECCMPAAVYPPAQRCFPCGRVRRKIISHIHDCIRCEEMRNIQIPSIYTIHSHYLPSLYT